MFFKKSSSKQTRELSPGETVLASFYLLSWLFLFSGGITLDTTKFRCAISPGGAEALAIEAQPGDPRAKEVCNKYVPVGSSSAEASTFSALALAWLGLLLFFLPVNLALVSATAGALGALGNKANLEHDEMVPAADPTQAPPKSMDHSNPIVSGLLRGLFVYLFFISGLLLFDDKPFSSPGPGQYIRLAGFISLISFLVNYRPHLFTTISDWAFERIARKPVPSTKGDVTMEKTKELSEKTIVSIPVESVTINGGGEEKKPETAPAKATLDQ